MITHEGQSKFTFITYPQRLPNFENNGSYFFIVFTPIYFISLPFEINVEGQTVREDLRLEYRFLDLRNEKIHQNIKLRSKILKNFRDTMDELEFTEIQTPILANSSPEGARDFLVPSRLHPGEFYALPQAPQQFKQL